MLRDAESPKHLDWRSVFQSDLGTLSSFA